MENTIIILFWLFWLCFWSFSTVLIDRWHNRKGGILFWRSECPSCHHRLWFFELIPMLSYIFLWGKCKNCHTKISSFYPFAEWTMMLIFMSMAYIGLSFWYTPFDIMWYIFLFWGFVTGVYILYDLRYTEIPDQIIVPGIYITLGLVLYSWYSDFQLFDYHTYASYHDFLLDHLSWAIILYTFLFLQILIPWWIYLLKKKQKKEFLGLLTSYFLFPILILINLNKKDTSESTEDALPAWVWWWDLRVSIFIWLTLGGIHGVAAFAFAYIIWSIVWVILMIKKIGKWATSPSSEIQFWPFLWIWWLLSLFFHEDILSYVTK